MAWKAMAAVEAFTITSLALPGMDADAMEHGHRVGGIEVFVFDFRQRAAVYRVAEVTAQRRNIQTVGAPAGFLVGGE